MRSLRSKQRFTHRLCVCLCRNTDRSMVVFTTPMVADNPLCLVFIIPNLLLKELIDADFELKVPTLPQKTGPADPETFPGIHHQLMQSDLDGHFSWDLPRKVDFSVHAVDDAGNPLGQTEGTIDKISRNGATFGKGPASVAPASFQHLNSVQNIEMIATYVPNGPYMQYYSPYRNEGLTGICTDGTKIQNIPCSKGQFAVIIGRNTTAVSKFMTRAPEKTGFAAVTSTTSFN
jgi:hypothetical protein